LLKIHILGAFTIDCGDGRVADAADFTPIQRNLLAILLSSQNLQVNSEIIQVQLWPDASEALTRKSFDTLLSRFRKSLDARIFPNRSKDYLVLEKGILSLENCKVDAREFTSLCEKGLGHYRKREFWQAGNCFYPAMQLWQGCFSKEIFNDDYSHEYCDLLQDSLAEMAVKWGANLMEVGHHADALRIIEKAWNINRTHEGLVRQLYLYHLVDNNSVQARQLLKKYATVLRQEEYSKGEIEALVARVSDSTLN
jgi:DNA-binding SARP family transcriptional activator